MDKFYLTSVPVLLDTQETGGFGAIASLLGLLLGFAAILVAAYWVTKLAAGRYNPLAGGQRRHTGAVEILSRTPVGQDRFLLVVRTGGKVLLLGSTPQTIQTLCELDPEQFSKEDSESLKNPGFPQRSAGFAEALAEFRKKYTGAESRSDSDRKEEQDGKD